MTEEIVLQERVTLDEAVLEGMKVFENGCNFRLIIDGESCYLEYGCYGVYPNISIGMEKLLNDWFSSDLKGYSWGYKKRLPILNETKQKLLERQPCPICRSPWLKGTIA